MLNIFLQIPKESEADEPCESIPCKTNEDVADKSVVTSSVKQEEDKKESEGQYLEAASGEYYKVEDEKSTEVLKEDHENEVKVTEEVVEVAYKGEEDWQYSSKEDEPVEKLEDTPHITPEETKIESLIQTNIASREVEGTTQNNEETSYAENKEENTEETDNANDSSKVV